MKDTGLDDDAMRDMIVDAYQEVHLPVPLSRIERSARALPRRRAVAIATAAAATAVAAGGSWAVFGGDPGPGLQPGDTPSPTSTASPAPGNGKPPRPSVTATTAAGRCEALGIAELTQSQTVAPADRTSLPPLRFHLDDAESGLSLRLYANENVTVGCWLTAEGGWASVNDSMLTTNMFPRHPSGQLSNVSSAHTQEPQAAYAFGRVPPGTTRVDIFFPDGHAIPAVVADGWYVSWAVGTASDEYSESTKVVAYTADGERELPIQHG